MTQIILLNNKTYEVKESPDEIKALTSDKGFIILQIRTSIDTGTKKIHRFDPLHFNINHITTMFGYGN